MSGRVIDIDHLQVEQAAWADRNFGHPKTRPLLHPALGMDEEAGELCHALLKAHQGIRGTKEEHAAAMRDAVGDICIYMLDFATLCGVDVVHAIDPYGLRPRTLATHVNAKRPLVKLAKATARALEAAHSNDTITRHQLAEEAVRGATIALDTLCRLNGWVLHEVVVETWERVRLRDWQANPTTGEAP